MQYRGRADFMKASGRNISGKTRASKLNCGKSGQILAKLMASNYQAGPREQLDATHGFLGDPGAEIDEVF